MAFCFLMVARLFGIGSKHDTFDLVHKDLSNINSEHTKGINDYAPGFTGKNDNERFRWSRKDEYMIKKTA